MLSLDVTKKVIIIIVWMATLFFGKWKIEENGGSQTSPYLIYNSRIQYYGSKTKAYFDCISGWIGLLGSPPSCVYVHVVSLRNLLLIYNTMIKLKTPPKKKTFIDLQQPQRDREMIYPNSSEQKRVLLK